MSEKKLVPEERREFLAKAGKVGVTGAAVSLLVATRSKRAAAEDPYKEPKL